MLIISSRITEEKLAVNRCLRRYNYFFLRIWKQIGLDSYTLVDAHTLIHIRAAPDGCNRLFSYKGMKLGGGKMGEYNILSKLERNRREQIWSSLYSYVRFSKLKKNIKIIWIFGGWYTLHGMTELMHYLLGLSHFQAGFTGDLWEVFRNSLGSVFLSTSHVGKQCPEFAW